ncbi:unnamed protein product [Parnassius apollo]|uniref:(apollo) hypothetical protein n=1 Tax=Parnassius apollo TaxID=110799 RepID=A0A8S3X2E3_PARAO|nr:unnamed protein product [Parnassius apollo]
MALENILSRMGLDTKQLTESHYASGNHKSNAAMSALTLLAFLFFLNILQQCLKDHMTDLSTPQVMIMSAGKESDDNFAKMSLTNKFDKTGTLYTDKNNFQRESLLSLKARDKVSGEENEFESQLNPDDPSQKTLLKIKTSEYKPQNSAQEYKIMKNNANQSFKFAGFYDEYEK